MSVLVEGRGGGWEKVSPTKRTLKTHFIASFPSPAQLSVACSTEKRGEPGIFSHGSML